MLEHKRDNMNSRLFILLIALIVGLNIQAQNTIQGGEYWFDLDFVNRQAIPVSSDENIVIEADVDVSTLTEGLHVIHSRYLDNQNVWSSVTSDFFVIRHTISGSVTRKIESFEGWFDSDFENRMTNSISEVTDYHLVQNLDVSELKAGVHVAHCRFKDTEGVWSSVKSKFFLIRPNNIFSTDNQVTTAEYWFDSGFNNRIEQTIIANTNYNLIQDIDVSALKSGLHVAHCRFKDTNGVWSSVQSNFFIIRNDGSSGVAKDIVSFEYWIDSDFNNRISDQVTSGSDMSLNIDLDVSEMKNGLHVLHYRFKDSEEGWSSAISKFFVSKSGASQVENNKISSYRYWIDGKSMTESDIETKAGDLVFIDSLELYNLRKGEHLLTIQFKDSSGVWSSAITDTIVKIGYPIAFFSLPQTAVCDSATLSIESQAYDADSISWTINNVPVASDTSFSYFFSDPGNYDIKLTAIDTTLNIDSTLLVHFMVNESPVINLGDNRIMIENDSLILDAGSGYITYNWSDDNVEQTNTIKASELGVGNHTIYVTVIDDNNCSGSDTVLVEVTPYVGIDDLTNRSVKIYPVPVKDALTIEAPEVLKNTSVKIYDTSGNMVKTEELIDQIQHIDMSEFPSGIYIISFENTKTKTIHQVKIIKK